MDPELKARLDDVHARIAQRRRKARLYLLIQTIVFSVIMVVTAYIYIGLVK